MNPIEVPFEAEVTCQNALPYSVKAELLCRCINSAEVAKQFASGEDPVAALLEQLKRYLREEAQQQPELDRDFCRATLLRTPLRERFISVEAIHDIEVFDKSTRFSFWLHTDDVTLKPANSVSVSRSRFRPEIPDTRESTRSRFRPETPDTGRSTRSRFRPETPDSRESTRTDKVTVLKRFKIEDTEQQPQGIFEQPGLELTNGVDETYTVWAEVHGRTGDGSEDNVKNLRSKIIEQLKLAAEGYEGIIDEPWVERTILATPRLEDFQSVVDSVDIPRSVQIIYQPVEVQLGSDDKPLQLDIGDGHLLEIEAKIGYITQRKASFNEEAVITRITEQLQMDAVRKGATFSEDDFREFISNLDLEKDFWLKFQEILYLNPIRFKLRIQTRDISFEESVRSKDGHICSVKANVNCRVIDEKEADEEALKSHLIDELKKEIRETKGVPEERFCEETIKTAGEKELGGFVVEYVYVELENLTKGITVELGKEKDFLLKTSTGHTYDLMGAEVYCRGLKDDDETRQQIRAYLESTLVREVQKIEGTLTPTKAHEILEGVGYIEELNVTVNTARLPELEVYSAYHTVPLEVKLKLPNGKGYVAEGNVCGNILDEENFNEDRFIDTLHTHLETRAANSRLVELTSEDCTKWIDEFPRFEEELFSLDNAVIQVNETAEIVPIELAPKDNPIEIPAANKKTYHLYGDIECKVNDPDTANTEDFKKAIVGEITKYVEKFSDIDKAPNDFECEEIARKVGNEKENLGITINRPTIHLRDSGELIEAEEHEKLFRTQLEIAIRAAMGRLEKLIERDSALYEYFIKVLEMRLQENLKELEIISEEREKLHRKYAEGCITNQEYDERIEVLKKRKDELLQDSGKMEFAVPSEEILEIQGKFGIPAPKGMLERLKESQAALKSAEQATQEDNQAQGENEEDGKEDEALKEEEV